MIQSSLSKIDGLDTKVEEISIPTKNGHSLAGCKFLPATAENYAMVITSATGVLQKYYAKFAHFFATNGITVYTFDYHGVGGSNGSDTSLKDNSADAMSWGQNDQAAVVALAKKENPDLKLVLVAHSIGGQLLGFNPNYRMLDKVVLVASQTGYWKYFKGIHKAKMLLFWYALIPLLTPIYGYFPAKKLRLFESLPKRVVYEWASWGRQPNYLMHFFDQQHYLFTKFEMPILSLSFSKDSFATKASVDWLAKQYKNADVQRVHHRPRNGERPVKHFGFFKSWAKEPYWEQCLQYIRHGTYDS